MVGGDRVGWVFGAARVGNLGRGSGAGGNEGRASDDVALLAWRVFFDTGLDDSLMPEGGSSSSWC